MTFTLLPFHRYRDAVRRGDASRAASHFQEAIEAYTEAMVVRDDDLTPDQEGDLRVRIAECYLNLGDVGSADLALAPAETLDVARLRPGTRGAILCVRGRIAFTRGEHRRAAEIATEAWEILRPTDENRRVARALTLRGHANRHLGNLAEAREDYTDAMAAARRAGDDHEIGLSASNLGFLLWKSGRYPEARRHHRRAVEIHEKCGSEPQLTRELFALSVDEFHCGDWKQVEALLTRCFERARKSNDRRLLSAVAIARGRLDLYRGKDPRPSLEAARKIAEPAGYANDLVLIGEFLGEAALERGDWEEARRLLFEALQKATASSPQGEPAVDTTWRLARAEEALGDPEGRVVDRLERAARIAHERGYRFQEAQVRRTLGEALASRGRLDEARRHLESAVSVFRELKVPFEIGRSLVAWASYLAEIGMDLSGVAPLFREAEEILSELGAEREAGKAADGLAAASGEPVRSAGAGDDDPFAEIVTTSGVMEDAIHRARRIAPSNIPVLLTGETGTGKELFARAIHHGSRRDGAPFLAVNCAALSESLLEAELFGHVKGAFTGAHSDKTGIFEAADGGTVFLDEIGKAPLPLQAKLLRVLDAGEVRRVGGVDAIYVDVRVVAATNRPLGELVGEEEFLPDLLYRLRGYEIHVPPLRERSGDVVHLFERFAARSLSAAAREILERYDWPGNVREIRNLAESVSFLTCGRGAIPADSLPDWLREAVRVKEATEAANAALPSPCLQDAERDALIRALEEAGGNRSRAARALGISRQTLYTKMSKLGIVGVGRENAA
jgi:DNA-binding NtrC family response regulator/Flp pilus assembly protein TadD